MKQTLKRYLIHKSNTTHIQFFRYIFVGGSASLIDMTMFYVANTVFDLNYLIAQTVGFSFGLTVSYLISIFWVFEQRK